MIGKRTVIDEERGLIMKIKREDIRNIAIIAHVDHGKTTLVDQLIKAERRIPCKSGSRRACHGLQ